MLGFNKATYLWLLFKFILPEILSNSLLGSDVLLFSEFINIVSILSCNVIKFIILLYTFLIIYFSWYKENMVCLISFSKFSDVLHAFTCVSAIGNLWDTCLGINILMHLARSKLRPLPFCCLLSLKDFYNNIDYFFAVSFRGISLLLI